MLQVKSICITFSYSAYTMTLTVCASSKSNFIFMRTLPRLDYLIVIRCQIKSVQYISLVVLCSGHVQVLVYFSCTSKHGMKVPQVQTVCKVRVQRMLERLKCSKLNGFSLYTPLYVILRTHPTTILFDSCPEIKPYLKADKDPTGIVHTLQSILFIGKYMLFFL